MKFKENFFILFKVVKQHTIPLAIILMAMILFFINFSNSKNVFATQQVAEVKMNVIHVNNGTTELLQQSKKTLTNNEFSISNLANINVNFSATSSLEFIYKLKNITDSDCYYSLTLNQTEMENLLIKYYIKDESGLLTTYSSSIKSGEMLDIRVVVSIENLARNATFNGDLMLTISNLGE